MRGQFPCSDHLLDLAQHIRVTLELESQSLQLRDVSWIGLGEIIEDSLLSDRDGFPEDPIVKEGLGAPASVRISG